MTAKTLTTAAFLATITLRAVAVDFSGPGGDVASPDNWGGGAIPSETEAVNFPASGLPAGGLSLSSSVTFGKTTFAAGAADAILFDLGGFTYTASGGLALKSGVTFRNGTIVAGGGRVFENVSGLSLRVTDGATFRSVDNFGLYRSSCVSLTVEGGSAFDCTQHANYNIAFYLEGVSDSALTFDRATAKFYTVNIGGKDSGSTQPVSNTTWTIRNGSAVTFHKCGNSLSRGVYLGASKKDGYSVSNRVVVADSTFDMTCDGASGDFRVCGIGDTLAVSNTTFTTRYLQVLNGTDCSLSFADSTVKGAISFATNSCGNVLTVANCATFPSVTVNGTGNRVILARGTLAAIPTFVGDGVGKTFELAGGAMTNTFFAFSGTNVSIVVRDGGRLQYGAGNVTKNGFNFRPGATKDYTLRIADGGTVGIRGMVNFSGNEASTYSWTNCPNSAIEFTGAHPSLVCHDYMANYETLGLGTSDEEPLTDAVKLRFVVSEGGYAEAPVRNEIRGRGIWIWGNQPIEVRLADGFAPTKALTVPLISCVNGFSKVPMDEARLAKLTANAMFPDPDRYRTALRYDANAKTLVATIRPRRGLAIIIR